MIGAIIGDISGSVYEFDNIHTKDFVLFADHHGKSCFFTDDTVMTCAVAKALLDCEDPDLCSEIKSDVNKFIKKYDFEMLMEIKDKGEVVRIYTTGNEKTVTQFILTASEYDAFTFICLDGTMSRADLEKAIAKATQQME